MNWVGGARSRVRQHAEKKKQKEFFERKRLTNKVQKFRPSPLSKVKAEISQDLLFLRTTAAIGRAKTNLAPQVPKKPLSLEPSRGGKQDRRSALRDLELPVSPIGRPSGLDLMDTSSATVLSESCGIPEWRDMWKGEEGDGGGMVVMDGGGLPRVSTQKIPYQTHLESFGPPKINILPGRGESHESQTVPMADPHLLNVSTMTESLFPSVTKRHKQDDDRDREEGRRAPEKLRDTKKYSLDEILEQGYDETRHHALDMDKRKHAPTVVTGHAPLPQGRSKRGGGVRGRANDINDAKSKPDAILAIAKGGWWQPEAKKPIRQGLAKQPQLHYDFDAWNYATVKKKKSKHKMAPLPPPPHKGRAFDQGMEAVSSRDGEAVLEFHYAKDTEKEEEDERKLRNGDRVCHHDLNQIVPSDQMGCPRPKEKCRDKIVPWISSTKSTLSVLSENPLSSRKVPPVYAGPPVSTSMDFDESIFGPLRRKAKKPRLEERKPHSTIKTPPPNLQEGTHTTPILAGRAGEKVGEERGAERGGDGEERRSGPSLGYGTEKKKSTFEMMMASLEQTSSHGEGVGGGKERRGKCSDADLKLAKPDSTMLRAEISNPPLARSCAPLNDPTLPSKSSKKSPSTFKAGNISVLQELMCLEEEIASHYEDGLLSQCSSQELGNSEDPLFNRPPALTNSGSDCDDNVLESLKTVEPTTAFSEKRMLSKYTTSQTIPVVPGLPVLQAPIHPRGDCSNPPVASPIPQPNLDDAGCKIGEKVSEPNLLHQHSTKAVAVQTDLEPEWVCSSTQTSANVCKSQATAFAPSRDQSNSAIGDEPCGVAAPSEEPPRPKAALSAGGKVSAVGEVVQGDRAQDDSVVVSSQLKEEVEVDVLKMQQLPLDKEADSVVVSPQLTQEVHVLRTEQLPVDKEADSVVVLSQLKEEVQVDVLKIERLPLDNGVVVSPQLREEVGSEGNDALNMDQLLPPDKDRLLSVGMEQISADTSQANTDICTKTKAEVSSEGGDHESSGPTSGQLLVSGHKREPAECDQAGTGACNRCRGVVTSYEGRIRELEERLGMAESTIVWQSIMIRVHQLDKGMCM